jgi:uncharacterized protein (TIGR00369 family)
MGQRAPEAQPFSALMGARSARLVDGEAVLEVPMRKELLQQDGFVHGGVISYPADNAPTFAGGSVLGPEVLTQEYKIKYLRPPSGGTLVAEASVVSASKRQAVWRCDDRAAGPDGGETFCAAAHGAIASVAVPTEA